MWALSQIARLQLKYSLKYSLTDRWCIKCFFHCSMCYQEQMVLPDFNL